MGAPYPLSVHDQRPLGPEYTGDVFVWDIDKTYLSTRFSSLGGLARIPIEFAIDKRAIPGMPEVLRGLRRGAGAEFACAPLYFVSASPPQLRRVVEHKMQLDGVEYDGIIFKDWLATLRRLRPGRLREQVGFKLCALLTGRLDRPRAREFLFGDDVERDAESFFLYAGLVSGRLSAGGAEGAMVEAGVAADDRAAVHDLLARLPAERGSVERAFIHLERNTPPEAFAGFAPLVVPVRGACQLALALFELGRLSAESARLVCRAAAPGGRNRHGPLGELLQDALDRGLLTPERRATLGL